MAQRVIAKGKIEYGFESHVWYITDELSGRVYVLYDWADKFLGQTIVISLEENNNEEK